MDKAMGMYSLTFTHGRQLDRCGPLNPRGLTYFHKIIIFLASIKEEIEKFPTGKFVLKKTIENVVEEDPNASGQKDQESDQKVSQGHGHLGKEMFFRNGRPLIIIHAKSRGHSI